MTTTAKAVRLRILMYIFTIVTHISNIFVTVLWVRRAKDDPQVQYYFGFSTRLFTAWTVSFLVVHAIIGLYCDVISLKYSDGKVKHLNYLTSFNDTFFSAIVWPSCWVCSSIFWFFFNYDANLLHITLLRKLGNRVTNHIGHTLPLFSVLWEVFYKPRVEPKSHKRNVILALSVVVLYILLLCYTYATAGTFIYPFLDVAYGTIYLPLMYLIKLVLTVLSYYAQWPISRFAESQNVLKKVH